MTATPMRPRIPYVMDEVQYIGRDPRPRYRSHWWHVGILLVPVLVGLLVFYR